MKLQRGGSDALPRGGRGAVGDLYRRQANAGSPGFEGTVRTPHGIVSIDTYDSTENFDGAGYMRFAYRGRTHRISWRGDATRRAVVRAAAKWAAEIAARAK